MLEQSGSRASLGKWGMADFAEKSLQYIGIGSDSELCPELRFLSNVVKLVRRRRASESNSLETRKVAIFLFCPNVPESILKATRVPRLENGLSELDGKLWFVNEAVVSGHSLDMKEGNDDEIYDWIGSDLELGDVPAILYDPRTELAEIVFYPKGMLSIDLRHLHQLEPEFKIEDVIEVIDQTYKRELITPDAQSVALKLWENDEKCWPRNDAEHRVQASIRSALQGAFPAYTIRHEQPQTTGRIDLEIELQDASDRSKATKYGLLELKVLRSFTSGGNSYSKRKTKNAIIEGVNQAYSYRIERGTRVSALCCFDMRVNGPHDTCFDHVKTDAISKDVLTCVWYLFSSSQLYRVFLGTASQVEQL